MENKTEINWWELRDKEYLYLRKGTLKNLIERGVIKAGSLSRLCIILNTAHFYTILKNNNGISPKKLRHLLDYLDVDYNLINNKILEIRRGNKHSIKNPKFPINLMNEKIGFVLGHLVSDGCLYYDKSRKNFIRTKYCGPDDELITRFKGYIYDIFGSVTFNEEFVRNCKTIRIGNSIVGESFRIAGVSIGKKYELNSNIPKLIKIGNNIIKRNYLSAIFDDEGSVGEKPFPYVILSRSIHIDLDNEEKRTLEKFVVPLMKVNLFPTGHKCKSIPIKRLRERLVGIGKEDLLNKIQSHKPRILIDESNLLKNDFGINCSIYVISLQLTTNLKYSIQSCLVIRNKEEVIKFYSKVGFTLKRKQNKLRNGLIRCGRLKYGSEAIQHFS